MVNPYPKQNQNPIFIALSGKKQVGKDTAAKIITRLLESHDKTITITSFAEPLKKLCIEILGLEESQVYGTDAQKNAPSHIMWDGFPEEVRYQYSNDGIVARDGHYDPFPRIGNMTNREVMQVMGTDIFRAIYNDVWANASFNRSWGTDVVILTDCRFPNEKAAVERHNGIVIRLERNTGFKDEHPSETALDEYAFEDKYQNDGSLEQLEAFILDILRKHGIINE